MADLNERKKRSLGEREGRSCKHRISSLTWVKLGSVAFLVLRFECRFACFVDENSKKDVKN